MKLTSMQVQILVTVRKGGGRVRSLLRLTTTIGIDYKHAWYAIQKLERAGLVAVERRRGHPLVIVSNPCAGQDMHDLQIPQTLRAAENFRNLTV